MVRASTYEPTGNMGTTTVATPETVIETSTVAGTLRRVSWGAIFGGVVIALVTQFLLSLLGLGIGVSTIEPTQGGTPGVETFSISAAIWWTVSGIISAFVGGWVAARLSGTPYKVSATLHGLVTWATTTLVVFYLLTTAAGTMIGGAFGILGNTLSGAAQTVGSVVPGISGAASGPLGDIQRQIEAVLRQTDPATAAQTVATVTRVVTGGSNVSQADREQAVNLLSQQAGLSPDDARQRLDQWSAAYQRNAAQIEQQTRQAAETTARVVAQAAIYGFIALVLGAIAGAIGGRLGAGPVEEATSAD